MRFIKLFSFLLLFIQFSQQIYSQSSSVTDLQKKFSNISVESRTISAANFFESMRDEMSLSAGTEMVLSSIQKGKSGYNHLRYKQFYKGLPVIGHDYLLHEQNGTVMRAGGLYTPQLNISVTPKVDVTSVQNTVYNDFKAITGQSTQGNEFSKPSLCIIDAIFPKKSGNSRLAYQIDIENHEIHMKRRYFIDAITSRIISSYSLIHEHNVPAIGVSKYYGIVSIVNDSIAPDQFFLRDNSRGGGINIMDGNGVTYKNNSTIWDLHNGKRDEVAIDAMYCSKQYYDMLQQRFGWDGVDGNGHPLNVFLHQNGSGNVNAFWDGENANFGDGDCNNGPLTTFEVLGHEFTHGLIQFTSGLIYSEEPGAINESIADMFGQALEKRVEPNKFSWSLGHSFMTNPNATPLRVMDDPKSVGMPAYYKGEFWVDGNDVHYNSSIGNLWFALLSDGRTGTTETGVPYDIKGISIEKALEIIFLANNAYNIPTTNYNELAANTVLAAIEIFGEGSEEQLSVEEAWKAVGVTGQVSFKNKDLAVTNKQSNNTTCETAEFIPFTVVITNLGAESYEPSEGAYISLNNINISPKTIPLDEVILPGESKTFEINDWIKYAGTQYETYNIDIINSEDENFDNNYDVFFLEYKDYPQNDLATFGFSFTGQACTGSQIEVDAGFYNNSCEALPAGTGIRCIVRDENNQVIYDQISELASELRQNNFIIIKIPLLMDFEGEKNYSIYANLENDPDLSNNTGFGYVKVNKSITDNYHQTFNQFPVQDGYLAFRDFSTFVPVNYNNEDYIGISGSHSDTLFSQHCYSPEEIFANPESNIEYFSACVDMSQEEKSFVEFDLVMFRNQYFEHTNYPYSCMVDVSWSGNESGHTVILAEEDGVEKHFSFPLPAYFNGSITLKFFAELGEFIIDENTMQLSDIILLDNFKITGSTISTVDREAFPVFSVYPNPAQSALTITSAFESEITQIQIINDLGQVVLDGETFSSNIDISKFPAGVYLLKIVDKQHQVSTKKFVKI